MSDEEAINNNCPHGGFKNESWFCATRNYEKCFGCEDLKEIEGKFFVDDPAESEMGDEYVLVKKAYEEKICGRKNNTKQ